MGNAVSLTSAYRNASRAYPITKRVIEVIQEKAQESPPPEDSPANPDRARSNSVLTLDGIKDLIKSEELTSVEIINDDKRLTELAKTALYQVKLHGKINQGFLGSPVERDELLDKLGTLGSEYNKEFYRLFIHLKASGRDFDSISETEEFKTLLPKMAELCKTWLAFHKETGGQLFAELFSNDYKSFKDAITPIFGGIVPHESLVEYLFHALNKEGNQEKIEKIKEKIQAVLETKITQAEIGDVVSVDAAANQSEELVGKLGEIFHEIFGSKDDITTVDGTTQDLELNPGLLTHTEKVGLLGRVEKALITEVKAVSKVIYDLKDSDLAKRYPLISCMLHGVDSEQSIPILRNEIKLSRIQTRLEAIKAVEGDRTLAELETIRVLELREAEFLKRKNARLENLPSEALEKANQAAIEKLAELSPEQTPISLCFLAGINHEVITQILQTFEQTNKNFAEIEEIKSQAQGETTPSGLRLYTLEPIQSERWETLSKQNNELVTDLLLIICNNAQEIARARIENINDPLTIPVSLELLAKTDPRKVGSALLTLLNSRTPDDAGIKSLIPILMEVLPVAHDLIDTITDNPKVKQLISTSLPGVSLGLNTQLEKFGYELHQIDDTKIEQPTVISEVGLNAQENIGKTFTDLLKGFDTSILDTLENSLTGLQGAVIGMGLKAFGLKKNNLLELSKTLKVAITASSGSSSDDLSTIHKQVGNHITALLSKVDIETLSKLEVFLGNDNVKTILRDDHNIQTVKTVLANLKTVKAELNKTKATTADPANPSTGPNTSTETEKTTFQKVAPIVVTAVGGLGLLGGIFMSSFEGFTRSVISGLGAIVGTVGLLAWFPNLTNFLNGENK